MLSQNWMFYETWKKHCTSYSTGTDGLFCMYSMPNIALQAFSFALRMLGNHRHAWLISCLIEPSLKGLADLIKKRFYHIDQVEKYWKSNEYDAIIIPTFPIPAFKSSLADDIGLVPAGTRLPIYWNYCSGTVPITRVAEDEQFFKEKLHNDLITKACNESMKDSEGLPVSIEVCGLPYTDEKILAIMKIIQEIVHYQGLEV